MGLLGARTVTRRRADAPTWTDGRPTASATFDTAVLASVQVLPDRDRQVLPEGVRQRRGLKLYCDPGTFRAEDQHAGTPGDVVVIDCDPYAVVHVDSAHPLIPHDRVYVVRQQEGE